MTLLDDALQIVARTGEHWLEAELYRHKGQLLLRQGQTVAAEELYRNALGIAEEQEAKLVYFGYPRAHQDDAERAVLAGLGVIDTVARLYVKSVELQARVGIATGLVVVGDLIGQGIGAGTIGRRRDAEPRRPAVSPGRAGRGGHCRGHAPAGRRSL